MSVRRLSVLLLALVPLAVFAGQGGWNASTSGVMLTYRGQLFNSAPLAPTPLQGVKPDNSITVVYWRHAIDGVYDPGLRVKLCTVKRCAEIEGGVEWADTGFSWFASHQRVSFYLFPRR